MTHGRLILIRHGETEWSRTGRHTGRSDIPLTPNGEARARTLVDRLAPFAPAVVLCSPLERARRTAELAGLTPDAIDEDLLEWDYGDYEGISTAEIRETVPDWTVWSHPSPGGESAEQVRRRLDRVIARVREQGGRTLVFGHGHALRALAARWLALPVADGRLWTLDTATVSTLAFERDQLVIRRWNA